jgi:hypothetical protein
MDVRLMLLVAGSFGLATTAMAEPVKPAAPATDQAAKERPVVLASADVAAATATVANSEAEAGSPAAPARKRRTARVTTCRCADTPNP